MQYEYDKICVHSKALICTVFSCKGLADARFLIGSKKVWDTQIYLVKTLSYTFFYLVALTLFSNSSCTNFELHKLFHSSKKRASQSLTVELTSRVYRGNAKIKGKKPSLNAWCTLILGRWKAPSDNLLCRVDTTQFIETFNLYNCTENKSCPFF